MGLVVANGFREAVQVEKGGVGRPALVVQPLRHVERFPVPTGKPLQITGAAANAEDAQHRHQQEEPLGVTHPTPESTIRYGLEETDQIARSALIVCGVLNFGHGGQPLPPIVGEAFSEGVPHAGSPAKGSWDTLLGGPGLHPARRSRRPASPDNPPPGRAGSP